MNDECDKPADDARYELCGCGRPVRYVSVSDPSQNACNKYGRCMTWDQQHELIKRQRQLIRKLSEIANAVDNGYCTICGRHRVWKFEHGKRIPDKCENPECVSHEIDEILGS